MSLYSYIVFNFANYIQYGTFDSHLDYSQQYFIHFLVHYYIHIEFVLEKDEVMINFRINYFLKILTLSILCMQC